MPQPITAYKVFIASPSKLESERKAFRDALITYNNTEAFNRGVMFIPVGWEETLGGIGRPQNLINRDITGCDYFIAMFCDRWGSPPDDSGKFSAATEEEIDVAHRCVSDTTCPMREVLIFFKSPTAEQLADPDPQLQRVLKFRKRLEQSKNNLFHVFDGRPRFIHLLTRHLAAWTRAHENGSEQSGTVPPRILIPELAPPRETDEDDSHPEINRAWQLADEGRRTDAEVCFARAAVHATSPLPLLAYGDFLVRDGRLDQALVLFERANEIACNQADASGEADALNRIGRVHLIRGDLTRAETTFYQALSINQREHREQGIAANYVHLGSVLRTRGDLDAAEQMHRRALEIDKKMQDPVAMADHYGSLGRVLLARGRLSEAEQVHVKALALSESLGLAEGMANQYGNLGRVLFALGKIKEAKEMFEKGLEIDQRLGRLEGIAAHFGNLGNIARELLDLGLAAQMYQQSLKIHEDLGKLEGMASCYSNLGFVLRAHDDLDGAEAAYRKSLEIEERLGRVEGMASDYGSLGAIYGDRGDLNAAEEMCRKAVELTDKLGGFEGMAYQYGNLATVLKLRGNLAEAEKFFHGALSAAETLQNPRMIGQLCQELGLVVSERKQPESARQYFIRSVTAYKSCGLDDEAKEVEAALQREG